MRFLVLGASSGLGRALAEELARANHDLLLVSSDKRDLIALISDFKLRYSICATYAEVHIDAGTDWFTPIQAKLAEFGDLDGILFPLGWSHECDNFENTLNSCRQTLEVNFISVCETVSFCLPTLLNRPKGFIIGFGSVASLRGRSRNVIYAAAKRALQSYFESLRHFAARQKLVIQFYQLGYLDSQQSYGKSLLFPKASLTQTARFIVNQMERDFGFCHYPWFWTWLQYVVRWMPWTLFKRLNF